MAVTLSQPRSKELGNFQTPSDLARKAVEVVARSVVAPRSVFEPTCGSGSFILAALERLPTVERVVGVEIDGEMLRQLEVNPRFVNWNERVTLERADVFHLDWRHVTSELPTPILILGNPPWVTNSEMGATGGANLPMKSNFKRETGIEAMTGGGNFDISEWIMMKAVGLMAGKDAMLAMLCKMSVARKLLAYAWGNNCQLTDCRIYRIDAQRHFGVSVDACLFVARSGASSHNQCEVFDELDAPSPSRSIGYSDGTMISDIGLYEQGARMRATHPSAPWRSGIKHDCGDVMELTRRNGAYVNKREQVADLERDYIYRLYKGTDVVNFGRESPERFVIVTQRRVSDDTSEIQSIAPNTWRYLAANAGSFNARRSAVYRRRPPFSMFGVGDYAFSDWKVAVSGFHKRLRFVAIPPYEGRPVMVDDTVYYLPCESREQAEFLVGVLNGRLASDFYSSMIFWDEKRPITSRLLKRLDLMRLISVLGLDAEAAVCGADRVVRDSQPRLTV